MVREKSAWGAKATSRGPETAATGPHADAVAGGDAALRLRTLLFQPATSRDSRS